MEAAKSTVRVRRSLPIGITTAKPQQHLTHHHDAASSVRPLARVCRYECRNRNANRASVSVFEDFGALMLVFSARCNHSSRDQTPHRYLVFRALQSVANERSTKLRHLGCVLCVSFLQDPLTYQSSSSSSLTGSIITETTFSGCTVTTSRIL